MVSLNDITAEADEEYGPFVLEDVPGGDVYLRNALRLSKVERQRLAQLNTKIKAAKGDANKTVDIATELLSLVAEGDGGERLVTALAGDAPRIIKIVKLYKEATQPGEASPSES